MRTVAQALGPALRAAVLVLRAALKGCATALLLTTSLHAATLFDPALRFRTVTTPHFAIYFHQGEDRLAARLAVIAEDTWRALYRPPAVEPPRRTRVVLADQTDLANGYATPLPYDTIVIYTVWPRGSEYIGNVDDWLRVAFSHEFTHIVHLDRSEGWARAVRGIFGRVTIAFPNLFLPVWQIEGLATYEESVLTGGGRLHAGDFAAVVDEAARAHAMEPLDRVNGGLIAWPGGNAPYAYGVGFHQYLADRFGSASLAELASDTARRLPYTGSRAFKHVYGESLGDLWGDYQKSVSDTIVGCQTVSDTIGGCQTPSDTVRLTRQGFVITGPRFDHDAPRDVVYSSQNADEFPALYRINLDDRQPKRLTRRYLGSTVAIGRDRIYFDQQEIRRNVGSYTDLYALSRATGHVEELTHDARLIDPDLSPDEHTIVAVHARPAGRDLVLVRLKPDAYTVDVLISEPDTQFNEPRWSPDGTRIAVERHRLGSLSEIVVVDTATRAIHTIASFEGTRAVTPAWRPDGLAVVAAAAKEDQVFNLYEFTIDGTSAPRQLTNVRGGATWPDVSPDGQTIVYVGYTVDGFDLFATPYPSNAAATNPGVRPAADTQVGPYNAPVSTPYSPFSTLKPTSWSPIIETPPSQVRAGAAIAGADVLGYHIYAASATWLTSGPDAPRPAHAATPDWNVSYFYDRWRPTLFLSASTETSFFAGPAAENGTPADSTLRELQLQAGIVLPIRHTRVSHTAFASAIRSVDEYTLTNESFTRNLAAGRGAWATTTAHTYAYSISPEDGVTGGTTIELVRRALGASANATTATLDVRTYLPAIAPHQVIAVRFAAGMSNGDPTVARTFLLGGAVSDLGVISFSSSAISLLRGFSPNTFAGSRVALVNADYRFPLARPQRGAGTWPLFLQTIYGALFADAGQAWTNTFSADAIKTSIGAELSANVVAGYAFPFTVTAGVGWGHDGSGAVGNRATAYARIGKSF